MESMMMAMLVWIGAQTGYFESKIPDNLPAIERRTQVELQRMYFCDDSQNCKDEELPKIEVSALFDSERGVMFLPWEFDPGSKEDQSTLVHELVHFVQKHNGYFERYCLGLLEAMAYKLSDKWREEKGLQPEKTNPARMMATSCTQGPT